MSELGVPVVVRDSGTLDDIGACTAPAPVEVGDLLALEHGPPLRVVDVLPVPGDAACVPVLARVAAISVMRH